QLHVTKSEMQRAVETGLTCARGLGIEMSQHPTHEEVQSEVETVWQILGHRSIESLVDVPLMTNAELNAAIKVLVALVYPTVFSPPLLHRRLLSRLVTLSLQHGTAVDSASAYSSFGSILGPDFHCYPEGYRFAKLAVDLVEKHGFFAARGRCYLRLA